MKNPCVFVKFHYAALFTFYFAHVTLKIHRLIALLVDYSDGCRYSRSFPVKQVSKFSYHIACTSTLHHMTSSNRLCCTYNRCAYTGDGFFVDYRASLLHDVQSYLFYGLVVACSLPQCSLPCAFLAFNIPNRFTPTVLYCVYLLYIQS